MLNYMDKKTEQTLAHIRKYVEDAAKDLGQTEACSFYSELADWAYSQYEKMMLDDDTPEMQNYEE